MEYCPDINIYACLEKSNIKTSSLSAPSYNHVPALAIFRNMSFMFFVLVKWTRTLDQ
jgi:hypothetical protein